MIMIPAAHGTDLGDAPVTSVFRQLLVPGIAVAEMDPRAASIALLHAQERAFVETSVAVRQKEFAAGRILARRLLAERGYSGPLLKSASGPAIWPEGYTGSITHCQSLAAAAVGPQALVAGIGIDVETRVPLSVDVCGAVLTADCERVLAANDPDNGLWIFCAKEAAFKAVYHFINSILTFEDLVIEQTANVGTFAAVFQSDKGPFGRLYRVHGQWRSTDTLIAAAATLPYSSAVSRPHFIDD